MRWPSVTVAARGWDDDGKNGSSSDAAITTMMCEHSDSLSMTPTDRTFDIVTKKGDLDCIMG